MPPNNHIGGAMVSKFASIHVRIKPKTVGIRWYQRGNKNPYIEDEQTTQWPKENVKKVKTYI